MRRSSRSSAEQRLAHHRLELGARDPVLADALGELHGRQHVDQRGDDRDREPGALGELADLARLVERRDQPDSTLAASAASVHVGVERAAMRS